MKSSENQLRGSASLFLSMPSPRALASYALFFLIMMMVGALAAFGWSKRDSLIEFWQTGNEQRQLVMSGQIGPVTYLLNHDDFSMMESVAKEHADILGVEMYRFPNTIAIAFSDAATPTINTVRDLPGVERMMRRQIPMLCHTGTSEPK